MKIKTAYYPENQRPINEWFNTLPIPWDIKKVEEADKKYEDLKKIHDAWN